MNFFQIFGFGKNKPMNPGDFASPEAKAAAAWLETVNPLRGMTAQRMQNLFDASRAGDTVHLQWLYQEIERADPTLLICQQRRTGALASLNWHISTRDEKRIRGFDSSLAQEQADALEIAFGAAEMANFDEACEHLARAFFRGFAHVLPKWSNDGLSIKGFDCLNQWNFVRDNTTGTWYWNPEAHAYTGYSDCRPVPPGELVTFVAPFHIDYPAMTIYLRSAVGEKGWAKFVERFGIPPVILTMPQDIPSDQVNTWRLSAEKVAEGGSGAVPFGTTVSFCDGARGINPFKDFVHNQRELIVLMSTGGLLTSLTEAGSGTLAGGAHADTWAEVRRMDAAKIGSVINRSLASAVLDRAFPGRAHLAYFAFDTEAVPSPSDVFRDAGLAKAAGYLVDQHDLEERTGYKLVRDESAMGMPTLANRAPTADKTQEPDDDPSQDLLAAFAKDTGPAADAIAKLLEHPTPEAAKTLLEKLPKLLPQDPAMAAIIAEQMAKEFRLDGEKLANEVQRIPGGNGNGGQFAGKTNQPQPREHHDKGFQDAFGTENPEVLSADEGKNMERGKSVITHILGKKAGSEDKVMYRKDVGWIGCDYGEPGNPNNSYNGGHGIAHIVAKHDGAIDGVVDILQHGTAYKHDKNVRKVFIIKDRTAVVLAKNRDGRLLITDFEKLSDMQLKDYTSKGVYHAKGEN